MTISAAFGTSMLAMNTQNHVMEQISGNIANMGTTSYKQVESHLETSFNGTMSEGGFDSFAVRSVDVRRVLTQGGIQTTGNTYDLALNGTGFFTVNSEPDGSGAEMYTRDGGFSQRAVQLATDSDGDGQNDQGAVLVARDGSYLMGWVSDGAGGFDTSKMAAVQVNGNDIDPATPTTIIHLGGNIANRNGQSASYNTSLKMISTDAAGTVGNVHNIPMTFTKQVGADNTWALDIPANSEVASATITPSTLNFRSDGTLDPLSGDAQFAITVKWTDGTEDSNVTLDMSKMTQYSDTKDLTVSFMTTDGYSTGRLDRTFFDSAGVLSASYSNGSTRQLYKLPVAHFASPELLKMTSGNTYHETEDSGTASYFASTGSDADGTTFTPQALEGSNVQLEDQFSKMIVTQKAYSMAATVFRTNDEMLQEIRNLM